MTTFGPAALIARPALWITVRELAVQIFVGVKRSDVGERLAAVE